MAPGASVPMHRTSMDVEKFHQEGPIMSVESSMSEDPVYVSWDGPEYVLAIYLSTSVV
jgi:hypothetical protein